MDARLTRTERLRKQSEIDAVYKAGRRWHGKFFRVHVKPNTLGFSRFTVSVPRRLCIAVLRNRWKRMLRESFRLSKAEIGPGLDIVAVPTAPPGELKRPQVEFVLVQLVKKHRTQKSPEPRVQSPESGGKGGRPTRDSRPGTQDPS
ncbi:MAG TPA: ribonuclease P protein component [Planctomycetota bacterium]|nr:ribonuclease P protein component [Planctomycetota bacterium]